MKFSTYNQQAGLATVNAPALQVSSDPNAYGGSGAGLQAMAKGISALAAGIEQRNEREDKATLMAFMNDMDNTRYEMLHNQQDGYLNRQGQNAQGIAQDYTANIEKVTQDKLKQYNFKTSAYKLAAQDMSSRANRADYQKVDTWEQKQYMATADLEHSKGLDLSIKQGNMSFSSPEAFEAQLEMQQKKTLLYASTRGFDKEQTDLLVKGDLGSMVASAIMTATKSGNFKSATELRNKYGDFLSAEQMTKLDSVFVAKQKADFARDKAEEYMRKGFSKSQVLDDLKTGVKGGSVPEQAEGSTWARMNNNVSLNGIYDNTRKGLDYAAKVYHDMFNKKLLVTSGTDGKHETHKGESLDVNDNWGDTVLADKGNRDRFKAELAKAGIYVKDEYEEDTKYKIGPHLHLDFTDYKGGGNSSYSREEQDEVYRQFEILYNRDKAIKREALNEFAEGQVDVIADLVGKADGLQQWNALMNKYIGDKDKYKIMKSLRSTYFGKGGGSGSGSSSGKSLTPYEKSALTNMMYNGDFHVEGGDDYYKGLEYVMEKWPNNLSAIDTYKKLWQDKKAGSGAFSFNMDGVVEDAVGRLGNTANSGHIKRAAKISAIMINSNYRDNNNGKNMPYPDLVAAVKMGIPAISYGKYKKEGSWFGDSDLNLSPNKVRDAGIRLIQKSSVGDTFTVYYDDGRVESMTGDTIMRRVEG